MKNFTKKLYLMAIAVMMSSVYMAQSVSVSNETAAANCDGSATLNNSFLYSSWNWLSDTTIIQSNGDSINGLCAGVYILEYTDSSGTFPYTFTVGTDSTNVCNGFLVSASSVNESADSLCDGSASASVSGGTAPYSYSWDNGAITANIASLCFGTYAVTVTDMNACTATASVLVDTDSVPNPCNGFTASATSTMTSGLGICDGAATTTAIGGTAPYAYLWSNGGSTSTITNLCGGSYTCTVTDSSACSYTVTTTVVEDSTNNNNLVANLVLTHETTGNACDGSALVIVTGGFAPYSYLHSNGQTTALADSLCAGAHNVMVIDSNGDSLSVNYLISTPANTFSTNNFIDSTIIDTLTSLLLENCAIDYTTVDSVVIANYSIIPGDTAIITWFVYDINGITTITNTMYFGSGNGTYVVVLSLYCSQKSTDKFLLASDQIYLNSNEVGINEQNDQIINIYPNPFKSDLIIELENSDNYSISIFDISGKEILGKKFNNVDRINLSLTNLSKGQYILKIVSKQSIVSKLIIK